jgi:acetoin utilization deacetylase AcuC-like enzyme
MRYGIMTDERFLLHRSRYDHPERPERLTAIMERLETEELLKSCERIPAREATIDELGRIHAPDYIRDTLSAIETGWGYLDPDTFFSPGTRDAALMASGGTADLARAVYRKEIGFGFAFNRPPGHHAMRDRAMGFCLFNHIAVAATALLDEGADRILIFDWDVHHGNGTQDAFRDDPRVLFISVHQWPHFPGSGLTREIGEGKGRGFTVNIPFPPGSSDGDYAALMEQIVEPLARAFEPNAVLVSAGFDAHERDLLAGMRVSEEGFAAMTKRIVKIAEKTGRGPCYVLEGGYDLNATAEAVRTVIHTTQGRRHPRLLSPASNGCLETIEGALEAIAPFWSNL